MTAPDSTPRPLIVGVGNRLRRDDGVGPVVADLVQAGHGATVDTAVVEGDLSDLAIRWQRGQAVVVVDAMASGRRPGTIDVVDALDVLDASGASPGHHRSLSSHGIGLADAIALARALGRLPDTVTIVAIEGETFGHGSHLSEPVEAAALVAVDRIVESLVTGMSRR